MYLHNNTPMITSIKYYPSKKSRDFFKKSLTRFYKERIIKKKLRHFCTTEKNQKIRRPKISFFGIFSYQVIVSGCKIDNIGPRKRAHPSMYDSPIHIDFPRSSLRTDRQTDKQTNRKTCLFY